MKFADQMDANIGRTFDGGSRIVVLISAAAALYFEASLGSRAWGSLLWITIVSGAAAFALAKWRPHVAWSILLGTLYLMPLGFRIILNREETPYGAIWMSACLGAILAGGVLRGWRFPARLRAPLAYWALAVALVWPLVIYRESDFWWPLMNVDRIGNSGNGGPPAVIAVWVLNVALTHLIGLLWFEAASSQPVFAGEPRFMRSAVLPLGIGAGIGCLLAVYQGTVDVNWLTGHHWGSENRAAGSLLDGDAFGALAALWLLGFLAIAARARSGRAAGAWLAAAFFALGAVWATGSRIAFLGAAAGLVIAAAAAVGLLRSNTSLRPRVNFKTVAIAIALAVVAVVGITLLSSSQSPVARLRASLPQPSRDEVLRFLDKEVWNRGGPYGDMTVAMVRAFPVAGVGVGSFNHLFPDFAYERSLRTGVNEGRYPFDNGQSWFRHHLAELGVAGSLGWIAWVLFFAGLLVATGGDDDTRTTARLIKGALVVAALISTVSMPTQNFAVSMTVWVFAAWYLNVSPRAAEIAGLGRTPRAWLWPWIMVALGLALFLSTSDRLGHDRLRPPMRAAMAHWRYRYGFHPTEAPNSGGFEYAWTSATRSVSVVPTVPGNWLEVTIESGPPDIEKHPLRLQLIRGSKIVEDIPAYRGETLTYYLRVQPGDWGVMMQINVDRTWNPVSYGGTDDRQLGIRVRERLVTSEQLGAGIKIS